jgi:hypothetical protein
VFGIFCLALHRRILRFFLFQPSYLWHLRPSESVWSVLICAVGVSAASYFYLFFQFHVWSGPKIFAASASTIAKTGLQYRGHLSSTRYSQCVSSDCQHTWLQPRGVSRSWLRQVGCEASPTYRQITKSSQASSGKLHRMTIEHNFTMQERTKITQEWHYRLETGSFHSTLGWIPLGN